MVSLYVIKTRSLFSTNFSLVFMFQTRIIFKITSFKIKPSKKVAAHVLSGLKYLAIASCFEPDEILLLVF